MIKKILFPLCVMVTACNLHEPKVDLAQYVDPFIGTDYHGHVMLAASVPFGMVQIGPQEPSRGWDWCSGYHYSDSVIVGFGHLHLSGTGVGDLGDICFVPDDRDCTFQHANEAAAPGYYKVTLDSGHTVELTATTRTALHRYTFANEQNILAIDLEKGIGWDKLTDCCIKQNDSVTISGYRHSAGWAKQQRTYFVAKFSKPVQTQLLPDTGMVTKARISVPRHIMVRVALSPNCVEGARKNLQAEHDGWDFERNVANARREWNKELAKIVVTTPDLHQKRTFYTAMYHSLITPCVFSDVDAPTTEYTLWSLWDTYRAFHPLATLIHPERQADWARSLMHIFQQQGKLPVWHFQGCETNTMVGSPGVIVLGDMVMKGYVDNREDAYQAMKASMLFSDRLLPELKEYGYIPYDCKPGVQETVAIALENAIADDAVARVAKLLGKDDDYAYFHTRSQSYAKYFDPTTRFMRAVSLNGEFRPDFDPFLSVHGKNDYTEGTAWQYTWLVPHDPKGLVGLFPSADTFVQKLDSLFVVEGDMGPNASADISGLIGQYAHGNEPSHHIPYLYTYVDHPEKTAELVRRILSEQYSDRYDGICGNEDAGQMSAWYVLSAMGFYQVEPCGGQYIFGSPLFNKAVMQVGNGKTFTILAHDNSDENIYIDHVTLNGEAYTEPGIAFEQIKAGGTLEFWMKSK